MKRVYIFLIFILIVKITESQSSDVNVINTHEDEKLLGKISKPQLEESPFNAWFLSEYNSYLTNEKILEKIKNSINQYQIKVFLGTWCGDSKREVPRFYKILDELGFSENQLEVVAVDKGENYKQSPNGEEKDLNIHRVPTFIFYKDGGEVNRIVERPIETLENDILKIISTNSYIPNYRIVSYLEGIFNKEGINYLKEIEDKLIPYFAESLKGSRELNTYGYIKLKSDKVEQAIYIFELNAKLFPFTLNVYNSLAEAYFINKQYDLALKNYYKVLSLKPDNNNALKMIDTVKNAGGK